MTSIKVKFRPPTRPERQGTIYYQVIHQRSVRQISTHYSIRAEEWQKTQATALATTPDKDDAVQTIRQRIARDVKRLKAIVARLESSGRRYTATEIVERYRQREEEQLFFPFMQGVIARLRRRGKERTAENYVAARNSFARFSGGEDLLLTDIHTDLMMDYQAWLKAQGVAMNTISFYMRILRAVYHRAVERELTPQQHPFRHVYTGIDKTIKRAITLADIKRIKNLYLDDKPTLDLARDMFLFAFYTRGMSFVDMAYLKKKDLHADTLIYRRRKTGQLLCIRWEACMQRIIDKYPDTHTDYLLPIIRKQGNETRQYRNALRLTNNKLKQIAQMAGLKTNLTMYVSRHSWASIARSKHVPLAVISEGMGHDSETTTRIYLSALDHDRIDQANEMILNEL